MIRDRKYWREWEAAYRREQAPDPGRAFRIVEALHQEARALGAFGDPVSLDRLAYKIKLARALNVPGPAGKDGAGP